MATIVDSLSHVNYHKPLFNFSTTISLKIDYHFIPNSSLIFLLQRRDHYVKIKIKYIDL